ncbi:DUF3179 domain-containing protein [Hyunsoonleella ulvae]|uniref:DUF3179 domain-containing protein n=1 Tax=Hyunsoonleella ulvae TaxID=2799948 RepID=UPI001939F752|nr:DUF3179 domain-containing protein [Hyunsoonleella ulvae]
MKNLILLSTITILLFACSSTTDNIQDERPLNEFTEWAIPVNEIRDGGPGKDGIPSIDNPQFINASEASFLNDNDLVVGIFQDGVARAYPHIVLDWHEVVNDDINTSFFTLNYCPLTGTAFAWESRTNNSRTTFGVSGLLYNANLIMYDRNTDSNWSQLRLECVNGALINDKPKLYNTVETNWQTWRALYPNTQVLSTQTGFSRNYGVSPYGDYATNNSRFIFRPAIFNDVLPNKERVYTIIDDNISKVYRFSDFDAGNVIKDSFNGNNYLIYGNNDIIYGFKLEEAHANLNFEYEQHNASPSLFTDNEGNTWSIFGEALSGPRTGENLTPVKSVMSYWFAIAAFYPDPEIYTAP